MKLQKKYLAIKLNKECDNMIKTLVLVEGKIDYNILKLELLKNSIIITLDFHSHKSLSEKKITHNFVEDYFNEKDKKQIDDLALNLGTNWYKDKTIEKILKYNELNLGTLLELEMPSYFFNHLKRIMGIRKIIEKENPKKIISYSLNNYIKSICKNYDIDLVLLKNNTSSNLFFDKIEIPLNLGFTSRKIKLSRKNYFRLKKTVDNISNLIWNTKADIKLIKDKKSIIIFDFHTINYKDLIKTLSSNSKNIIILNQRKPAIWNFESLNIIKNSKCKILSLEDFKNKNIKIKINKEKEILEKKLDDLWKKDDVMEKIFLLNNESFWEIIKEDFSQIIKKRLTESIERFNLLKELFDKITISVILDWAHVAMEEKELVHMANKKDIPIFSLQHGIMTLNSSLEKYLPLMPVLPSNNTKMLVWGKTMESYLSDHNVSSTDVKIIGSPRHDRFFKRRNETTNNLTILIASNNLFHVNFNGNETQAYQNLEYYIKNILKFIKLNTNKKPIIKLHSSEYFNIAPIINKIDQNIPIYQHEDLLPILETCDSLISLNYSTILVDGLILKKPTMVILPEKQNFEQEEIIKKDAVAIVSNKIELETKLNDFLCNKQFRENLISNGENFVDEYFSFQGNSSKILSKFLVNINKN